MNQSCCAIIGDMNTKLFTHQLTLHLMKILKEKALGGAIFKALVTKDFDEQLVLSPTYKLKTQYNTILLLVLSINPLRSYLFRILNLDH